MYWFLGIVKKEDVEYGNWNPSYILCASHGTKETRSPWRVVKNMKVFGNMPKVLVTTPIGQTAMVDFLSNYRTRDHMHGSDYRSTKKYYPEGMLCWFPCDRHGDRLGPALLVKKVPDKKRSWSDTDQGLETYKRMIAEQQEEKLISQVISSCAGFEGIPEVKPTFIQKPLRNTHFFKWT